MLNRLYWIFTAAVLAVAVHAAYLLIAPGFALGRSLLRSGAANTSNVFRILKPEDQTALFPTYPASSVFGVCAFDVTKASVDLSAVMPDGYWTLTIYSRKGDVIYALNSIQSGTNTFTVSLNKAPDLLETLTKPNTEDPGTFNGWKVATVDSKGIAVLWVPLREVAQRTAVTRVLSKSVCQIAS